MGRAGLAALAAIAVAVPVAAQTEPVGVPSLVADGYPRQPGVDVLHYDLAIELPEGPGPIEGRARILFDVLAPGIDELGLDLEAEMAVDSVAVGGRRVAARRAAGRLVVDLAPAAPGTRREATVWYRGRPADGLVLAPNRHGDPTAFADNWADRASHWFPGIDHPYDKATVDLTVVAPSRYRVVANGYLRGTTDLGDGRTRTRWSETAEIPTYCVVFGAAEFAVERAGRVGDVEVTHWTFQADSAAGSAAFSRSVEILGFYDSLFGPYPYEKLAHVQSATKFGGMENASAIFYDQNAIGEALAAGAGVEGPARDGLVRLVAHETVHQWFGDAVTEADWNHLWLSEGFATYFAAVFFELHGGSAGRGPAELARRMAADRDEVVGFFHQSGQAVLHPGPGPGEYEALLNPNNYPKGAWVLHMLRRELGDATFFAGIRDYYAELRDGTAWTADFERVMEQASGMELAWFFEQWIGRPGHPVLEVGWRGGGDAPAEVVVAQVQPGAPFRFELEVELGWRGGARRERIVVDGRRTTVAFDTPAPLEAIVVDPDAWLLHEVEATSTNLGSGA